MRTTGFGYGKKQHELQRSESPPPGSYTMISDFEKKNKGSVFSFGIAREAYSKVYQKSKKTCDPSIPGPGTYETSKPIGWDASKYSLRPKTTLELSPMKHNPGPGAYSTGESITPTGE